MKFYLQISLAWIALFTMACSSLQQGEKIDNNYMQYTGTIITKSYTDKIGNEHEEFPDLYFSTDTVDYFIKFSAGKVVRKDIKTRIGEKITIEGNIATGLWDTDDPNVQSRVGEYISIIRIVK